MAERISRGSNSSTSPHNIELPDSLIEASRMRRHYYENPAMRMVEASIDSKRACNQGIIFTYGVSGTGASATLNHLFKMDLIPTSESKSETTAVSEYMATLTSDYWKANNLKISFINLPGFGDTKGDHQDVTNLAAIEEFIAKHNHLGSKFYKCYPNIVLVTMNATEYRIQGENSKYNLMFKVLKQLEVVDVRRPNLLIVLTHVMCLPIGVFSQRIKEMSDIIQEIIKAHFGIQAQIAYVENNVVEYELSVKGDWTVLPDGTDQPLNVFEAMIQLMKNCGDEVGVETIRLYFSDGKVKPLRPEMNVDIDIIPRKDEVIHRWSRAILYRNLLPPDTHCANEIKKYQGQNPEIARDALIPLMMELKRVKIHNPEQINNKSISEIQKQVWPYILNETDKEVLIDLFHAKPLCYKPFLDNIAHGCYTNEIRPIAPKPIFILTNEKQYKGPRNGIYLPPCIDIIFKEDTNINCFCTNDNADAISSEMNSDSIGLKTTSAYNDTKSYTFAFIITHSVFYLSIQSETQEYINGELKRSVRDLPDYCRVNEHSEIHPQYLQLLKDFGHSIRTHWEGGGNVTGQITVDISDIQIQETEGIMKKYLRLCFCSSNPNKQTSKDHFVKSIFDALDNTDLTVNGGNTTLIERKKLRALDLECVEKWKRSLWDDPIPLEDIASFSSINIPISSIVHTFDKYKSTQIQIALDETAPEHDLMYDRISVMEADLSLCNQIIEETTSLAVQRRSRRCSFIGDDWVNIEIEELRDHLPTRQNAALRARSNTIYTVNYGYPNEAKVWMKKMECSEPEEVQMINLEVGDLVECINNKGQRRHYVPIMAITKDIGEFHYVRAVHEHGRIEVGALNILYTGRRMKRIPGRKLRIKNTLVWSEPQGAKVKTTRIRELSLAKMSGNIQPQIANNDSVKLIVNGIICGGQDNACFPGNATVVLRGGERVRMDELKIGDYVLSIHPTTHTPVYSKVYLWAHRDPHITATFLHITHTHGHLHISANHLILTGDNDTPVPSHRLTVGDSIHFISSEQNNDNNNNNNNNNNNKKKKEKERGDSHTLCLSSVHVLHIHTCTQMGYYTPFTNNGLIVVDNIATSVYCQFPTHSQSETSTCSCHTLTRGLVQQFGMHRVGQCVLTPVRVGCKLGMGSVLSRQMDIHTHIHKYCQWLLNAT